MSVELETARLSLRPFRPEDLEDLDRIYSDPEVMRFMGPTSMEATEAQLRRLVEGWERDGISQWAAIDRATGALIGRIGLLCHHDWREERDPIEVGWLLDRPYWGKGLATEGGLASIRYGFQALDRDHIISITRPENLASRRVMEKCGLTQVGETWWRGFDHVWYRIDRGTRARPD